MANNQCPFYLYESTGFFSSRETCKVTGAQISSTTYKTYCNGNYDVCPNFKPVKSSSGSICFITSACVEAMGLCDSCVELTTMRSFRDNWLSEQPEGRAEIAEYYRIAPRIVDEIHSSGNSMQILKALYDKLVQPCVEFVLNGECEKAYELYRQTIADLKAQYL